jgi:phage-related protein
MLDSTYNEVMRKPKSRQLENRPEQTVTPSSNKPLYVLHGTIKTPPLSSKARLDVGFQLRRVQHGEMLSMPISRPMPTIGPNCHELRISDIERHTEWRVIYCIDHLAILILDVFE